MMRYKVKNVNHMNIRHGSKAKQINIPKFPKGIRNLVLSSSDVRFCCFYESCDKKTRL